MKKRCKRAMAILLAAVLLTAATPAAGLRYLLTLNAAAEDGSSFKTEVNGTVSAAQSAELTFSDGSITETEAGDGYSIDGTVLTITAAGTYRVNGEVLAEYTVILFGDLDGNGMITAADYSKAMYGLSEGFEDDTLEFAANIVKTSKRDKFSMSDISALMNVITGEPLDQEELAQTYAYNGW